jgi:hypothetical protein
VGGFACPASAHSCPDSATKRSRLAGLTGVRGMCHLMSSSPPHRRTSLAIALAPYLFVVAFISILAATVWGLRVVGGA